jgi:hypothetical protein
MGSNRGSADGLLGYEMGDGCDVRIEAARYRQLARDFHLMARNLTAGEERAASLKMAEEYKVGPPARARHRFTAWRTRWPTILKCLDCSRVSQLGS